MEYCFLGNSGLEVTRIGLGAIPFGTTLDEATSQRVLDIYQEAGGNLIDTSNLYGGGMRGSNLEMAGTSERTVGKVVKGKRDRFVIATKGCWLMENEVRPNSCGLSRTYLATQIEASLRRLGSDYIDLYQCHAWDFYTPVEETLRVLDGFVRAGKIRYWGVSNWDGWWCLKANEIAKQMGLTRLISNQIWYTLADRVAEHEVIPACEDQDISVIAFGAVAQGFLSGKYTREGEKSQRADNMSSSLDSAQFSWKNLAIERNWNLLDKMHVMAERMGKSVPNLAQRWLLDSGRCDVVLGGVSRLEQFEENMKIFDWEMAPEDVEELREASELTRPYPLCFHDLFCHKESEFYGGLR